MPLAKLTLTDTLPVTASDWRNEYDNRPELKALAYSMDKPMDMAQVEMFVPITRQAKDQTMEYSTF